MITPDYKKNCIVNLMSSISRSFGIKNPYNPMKIDLKYKNVILLNIDGLGYNYICHKCKGSFLEKNMIDKMKTVFPATTATATIALATGVPAQQHGLTGWSMFLKEVGCIVDVLPFMPTYGGNCLVESGVEKYDIHTEQKLVDKIKNGFAILPSMIVPRESEIKKPLSFKTMDGMFKQIKNTCSKNNKRKLIYAYWPVFDKLCHKFGPKSKEVFEHFEILNKKIETFSKKLKDTLVIITADHGFVEVPASKVVDMKDHPKLKECLIMPMCGDSRVKYCYVHPSKAKEFEKYIKTKMNKCCKMFKGPDLIKNNWFGLFKPHPKLFDRIGDYVLICKDNYKIKEHMVNKIDKKMKGHHSGTHPDEMFVPLILIKK